MRNRRLFYFRQSCASLVLCLLSPFWLLLPSAAFAQMPGLGMGWLLNPEGSRLFPQAVIYPRHPGKPDIRWKVFDWHFRDIRVDQTGYRLYFYDVSENPADPQPYWTAEYASPIIDLQIRELANHFQFWPRERFSYLLFSSYREFQQANVFFIEEGVQGVTSTQEPTMAIPYWGERETFRHISHHELTHQFQVQKINELSKDRNDSPEYLMPLWFIEGMAEYYSRRGIDTETRSMLRDLWFHPADKDSLEQLQDFFEPGPYDFQHVYKLGQLKNAFLESRFGKGTIQRVLEESARHIGSKRTPTFQSVVLSVTAKDSEEIQREWVKFFKQEITSGFENAADLSTFNQVQRTDTLDHFVISPDGRWLLSREIDTLTGGVSLYINDLSNLGSRREITHDRQSSAVSLYFFQAPSLAISNRQIAFMALTANGPELELRTLRKDGSTGPGGRTLLHQLGLSQAHSPAFSPDGKSLVFIGINSKGWQNLYVLADSGEIRQITRGTSSWRSPSWTSRGILVSTDQISGTDLYGIFLVNPATGETKRLIAPELGHDNLLEATAIDPDREVFFRSTNGSGQQLYRWSPKDGSQRITFVKTQLTQPLLVKSASGVDLYALGFQQGRYRLYKIQQSAWLTETSRAKPFLRPQDSWSKPVGTTITPFPKSEIQNYRSFRGTGVRIEDLAAFFSSGSVFGLAATVSDLMRDYVVSAELLKLGGEGLSNASVFVTSERGRSTWTLGAYTTQQARLDAIFDGNVTRLYDYREYGLLAGLQYPTGAFSYMTALVRVGGVKRENFDDPLLSNAWSSVNPGSEFIISPTVSFGFDQIQYEAYTGPIRGFGLLFEAETSYFPGRAYATERLRLDVAQYEQLWGRTLLALQGMAGLSFNLTDGTDFRNPFLVSSDDIFRAYSFGDDRLRGNYLLGAKAELRFPIGEIFGFEPLRGILSTDYGSIWRKSDQIGSGGTSSWSSGLSLNLPPLSMSFLISQPIRVADGPQDSQVLHFTLRYLYL